MFILVNIFVFSFSNIGAVTSDFYNWNGSSSSIHAGYGYLGASSEAEAEATVGYLCMEPQHLLNHDDNQIVCVHKATTLLSEASAEEITQLNDVIDAEGVQAQLKQKIMQYLSARLLSMHVNTERLSHECAPNVKTTPQIFPATQYTPQRIFEILALDDQLNLIEQKSKILAPMRYSDAVETRKRLHEAYPFLFEPMIDPKLKSDLMNEIYSLYSSKIEYQRTISKPARRGDKGIRDDVVLEITKTLTDNYAIQQSSDPSAANPFSKALDAVLVHYSNQLISQSQSYCAQDLETLINDYPTVVRQMILDNPQNKGIYKRVLCSSHNFTKNFKRNPRFECKGVKTRYDKDGTITTNVDRNLFDWPYYTKTQYGISKQLDGSYVVNLPLKFAAGHGTKTEDITALVDGWIEQATQQYQKTYESVKQSDDPIIKFQISVEVVNLSLLQPSNDIIKVHQCFSSDLKGKKRTLCAENNQAAGGNRQDDHNWVPSTTSVVVEHELGHILGLDDEYVEDNYHFNLIGEENSLMRHTQGTTQLKRRHFLEILTPALQCSEK